MEPEILTEKTFCEKIEIAFNIINHIFIGFVAIYVTWACFKSTVTTTAIHGWLCTLGYQLLMAEAIMCFYSANYSLSSYSRQTKATIHWVLQVIGSGMALVGAIIKFNHKDVHFKTVHAITGLIATILLFFGLISGLSALYAQRLRKLLTPVNNKTVHNLLGIFTFVIGMGSLCYGYDTGFFSRRVDRDFAKLLKAITAMITILTIIGPIKSVCRNVINIFGCYEY